MPAKPDEPGEVALQPQSSAREAAALVELIVFPNIGQKLVELLGRAEQSVVGTAYCFDLEEGVEALHQLAQNGIAVRVLLDAGQRAKPSCRQQSPRVCQLLGAGVEFKELSLKSRGEYAILHAKTWAIDGSTYIGGSANFTRNACRSEENLVIIRDEKFLNDYHVWFCQLWDSEASRTLIKDDFLPSDASLSRPN